VDGSLHRAMPYGEQNMNYKQWFRC